MRNFLGLPSTLLLLLAISSWSTAKDDILRSPQARSRSAANAEVVEESRQHVGIFQKRDDAILRRLLGEAPVAVKKMSDNPGEKFFPEYWQFSVGQPAMEEMGEYGNASIMATPLSPPLLLHSEYLFTPFSKLRSLPRNIFEKRDYKCPTGTNSCASIGYPYSCCAADQTCMMITDTGIGNVGCCPTGQTCGGSVSSCNTAQGYSSCPGSSNGGCCIPGYTCDSVGCVAGGTITVTESLSTGGAVTVTEPITTVQAVTTVATTIVAVTTIITSYNQVVTTATVVLTEVVIITTSSSIAVSTVYITTTTPTGTAYIGVSTAQTTIFTTITQAVPPERPTSDSTSTDVTTITTTATVGVSLSTLTAGYCPTGFYQCSAYYDGGCCRVGQDCDTSSCPSSGSTEVVVGSVVTIIVGTGYGVTTVVTDNTPEATTVVSTVSASTTTTTTTTPAPTTTTTTSTTSTNVIVVTASTTTVNAGNGGATCAVGWYNCDASNGGGCCPTGYSCAVSCIATQSGEPGHVYKVPLNQAAPISTGLTVWFFAFAGVVVGSGMLFC